MTNDNEQQGQPGESLPRVNGVLLRWFSWYSRRFLRKHFNSIQALNLPPRFTGPVVIYANHPSWWDPLVLLLLSRTFWPERRSFAPIEAKASEKYKFFTHLGFFPVTADPPGALRFLRMARVILGRPDTLFWLTPQSRFCDSRLRPPGFRQGIGHLAVQNRSVAFLPLAIEYVFGPEKSPEVRVNFGNVQSFEKLPALLPGTANAQLEHALAETQDELARAVVSDDRNAFQVLLSGRAGTTRIYDTWRRLKAAVRGQRFHPQHRTA